MVQPEPAIKHQKGNIMRLFFLIFCVVGFNSAAQIFLKAAAMDTSIPAVFALLALAFACLGISFLCWFVVLRHKPLSFLHPFAALVYVVVPGLAALVFGEAVSGSYIVGIIFIVTGIYITSGAVGTQKPVSGDKPC